MASGLFTSAWRGGVAAVLEIGGRGVGGWGVLAGRHYRHGVCVWGCKGGLQERVGRERAAPDNWTCWSLPSSAFFLSSTFVTPKPSAPPDFDHGEAGESHTRCDTSCKRKTFVASAIPNPENGISPAMSLAIAPLILPFPHSSTQRCLLYTLSSDLARALNLSCQDRVLSISA
jgi:hypothetical protein